MHDEPGSDRVSENQAKVARLPATPPVLHDAGSEILRSLATVVLLENAAHALQSEKDDEAEAGQKEGLPGEGHTASPRQGYGPNAASKQPEIESAQAKELETTRLKQELKELCERWKPVSQVLASRGCVGVWRLDEVLPAVV